MRTRRVERDVVTGLTELINYSAHGFRLEPSGHEYQAANTETYRIVEGDPLSAAVKVEWTIRVGCGDWQTRVKTLSEMTADRQTFRVTNVLEGFEGETRVFAKTWNFSVPRDCV